jgi:hypothetical protein
MSKWESLIPSINTILASIEAQCLNRIADVAEYLGPDGLGQFITGAYAANDPQADMQ